jgi:hypothetical protein
MAQCDRVPRFEAVSDVGVLPWSAVSGLVQSCLSIRHSYWPVFSFLEHICPGDIADEQPELSFTSEVLAVLLSSTNGERKKNSSENNHGCQGDERNDHDHEVPWEESLGNTGGVPPRVRTSLPMSRRMAKMRYGGGCTAGETQ